MRPCLMALLLLASCSDSDALPAAPDASPLAPDASPGAPDASPAAPDAGSVAVEDLDLEPSNLKDVTDFMTTARGYRVANPLGHEAEALAAANSGAAFPVGSVVKNVDAEIMVKRRAGFRPAFGDWEFITVTTSNGTVTAMARDEDGSKCFHVCHEADAHWDYICAHP